MKNTVNSCFKKLAHYFYRFYHSNYYRLGIDIGKNSLSVALLSEQYQMLKIVYCAVLPYQSIPQNPLFNEVDNSDIFNKSVSIQQALQQVIVSAITPEITPNTPSLKCIKNIISACAIPDEYTFVETLSLPENMPKAVFDAFMRQSAENNFKRSVQNHFVDHEINTKNYCYDYFYQEQTALLVVTSQELLKNTLDLFKTVSIKPHILTIHSAAVHSFYHWLITKTEQPQSDTVYCACHFFDNTAQTVQLLCFHQQKFQQKQFNLAHTSPEYFVDALNMQIEQCCADLHTALPVLPQQIWLSGHPSKLYLNALFDDYQKVPAKFKPKPIVFNPFSYCSLTPECAQNVDLVNDDWHSMQLIAALGMALIQKT